MLLKKNVINDKKITEIKNLIKFLNLLNLILKKSFFFELKV
jgi:hypothetical protein